MGLFCVVIKRDLVSLFSFPLVERVDFSLVFGKLKLNFVGKLRLDVIKIETKI